MFGILLVSHGKLAEGILDAGKLFYGEKVEKVKTLCLEQTDGPLTAFNEDDWYSLVEYATVYSREDIRFTFKNGMEIKA